jgi:hypothetical protein
VIGNRQRLAVFGLVCLVLVSSAPALGAAVSVSASIEPDELYLGDRAVLSISIEGPVNDVTPPEAPQVEGLTIQSLGAPARSTQIVNNRLVHQSLTYRYAVSADKIGDYTIPPLNVVVDGQTLATAEVQFHVVKAPAGGPVRLSVEVSKAECWQLEPVEVTYRWAVRTDVEVQDYALAIPLLTSGDRITLEQIVPPEPERQRLSAGGSEALFASVSQERIEGSAFVVRTIRLRLYPEEPGELVIAPASVRALLAVTTDRRDIWGDRVYERASGFAATEETRLRVNALPLQGRPGSFDGAVGQFTVSTTVSETRAHVDDPLRLTITVKGDGLLRKIKRPLLTALPDFASRFKINETLEPGEVAEGRISFEQVIRPKSTDVTEIPPVQLAYFDPATGRYEVTRSAPLPITVLPTTTQSIETFGADAAQAPATELTQRPGGIYANVTSDAALADRTPSLAPLWALLAPPLAYGAALVATRRRRRLRHDLAFARARGARRAWRARLAEAHRARAHGARSHDDASFFDALARAVGGYVADRLNLGQGELTAADIAALTGEGRLPEAVGTSASAILERCDAARFAPHEVGDDGKRRLLAEAEAFGRAARRALRRKS